MIDVPCNGELHAKGCTTAFLYSPKNEIYNDLATIYSVLKKMLL